MSFGNRARYNKINIDTQISTDKTVCYVYRTRNYATEIWILNHKTCAMLESAVAVEY